MWSADTRLPCTGVVRYPLPSQGPRSCLPQTTPSVHACANLVLPPREDSDKDRDRPRPRVVLGGQPYVAEGARGGILTQEVRERMERHASSARKDKMPEKAVIEGEEIAAAAKDE